MEGGVTGPDTLASGHHHRAAKPRSSRFDSSASYRQILGSSATIAGASLINMVIGMVRAKAFAMMLGPAGVGLVGAFTALADLVRSVAMMGIGNSGVRQVAEAVATDDRQRIARTVWILRRTTWVLGLIGAGILVVGSHPLAVMTFGDDAHAWSVALLGLAVMCRIVSDGQGALLQGMRNIGDMARVNIYGAFLGTTAGIALVWKFGIQGVAASLVAVAASSMYWSWRYSRKVRLEPVQVPTGEALGKVKALVGLGVAFMCSAMLMMGAAYAVRLILIRTHGLEAAGLYSASWTLGGLYVGVVLQAMSADFYPRLVALARDDEGTNRLVNEQAQVSMLLAATGVLATLSLAPIVLTLFYSTEFFAATRMLQWICLGMAMRVFSWPMGYVVVARYHQVVFITVELAWTVVYLGLAWFAVGRWGPDGAGIAFFAAYVFHGLLLYPVVRRMTGYRWWRSNLLLGAALSTVFVLVHAGFEILPLWAAVAVGGVATVLVAVSSLARLSHLVAPERVPPAVRRLLSWVARQQQASSAKESVR